MDQIWLWVGFNAFVLVMLAVDLGVFHRHAHEVSLKEAAVWSSIWVGLSLLFALGIYRFMGPEPGLEFLTGYLIEKSLSVDNIFVFVIIFSYFRVPAMYQHRVLFWGILGALVMRGVMILTGAFLIQRFEWILYVFGGFLVLTGIRMAKGHREIEPEKNPVLRLARRVLPTTHRYYGQSFLVREKRVSSPARLVFTPLFIVLLLVETTDVIFALDSIPAIFAITRDPFIVYSSNIMAILGLRALYFLLAGVVERFHYLQLGLAGVLTFVGVKMLIEDFYHIPVGISLGVIGAMLTAAIVGSLLTGGPPEAAPVAPPPGAPTPQDGPGGQESGGSEGEDESSGSGRSD